MEHNRLNLVIFLLSFASLCSTSTSDPSLQFPKGFLFGAGTSAYQIEGAWNEGGKSPSIWDTFTHDHPEFFKFGNGDVSCDSYHFYKEDIAVAKEIGIDLYRLSISWPRVLPNGKITQINQIGIDYYNNVIDEILRNNMTPFVTIFQWDLPQVLEDEGGWMNPKIIDYFIDYADLIFKTFGDRVKYWNPINEIATFSWGYEANLIPLAPGLNYPGTGSYLVVYHMLKAHAAVYSLYKSKYADQGGQVGLICHIEAYQPKNASSEADVAAAKRAYLFSGDLVMHPILIGDYPEEVRSIVDANSKAEGLSESRLPRFTQKEIEQMKGTTDFVGINHYTTFSISAEASGANPSYEKDCSCKLSRSGQPSYSISYITVVPEGIRHVVNYVQKHYNNPPMLITECGYPSEAGLDDDGRINYFKLYMGQLLKAIEEDGANVGGFIAWGLLDDFEWYGGLEKRFGLVSVDFDSPYKNRTLKKSGKWYKKLIKRNKIRNSVKIYVDDEFIETETVIVEVIENREEEYLLKINKRYLPIKHLSV